MSAARLISHYNHLNGNSVRLTTLISFHGELKRYLTGASDGLQTTAIKDIHDRLTKAITSMRRQNVESVDRIVLKPVRAGKEIVVRKKHTRRSELRQGAGVRGKKVIEKKEIIVEPEKKSVAIDKPVKKVPQKVVDGFMSADQVPSSPANLITPAGPIGDLLGKLQMYKLVIIIAGETHSSKSQLGMQIADSIASTGEEVAWVDYEQGGLHSADTQNMISWNVKPENRKFIKVNGDMPRTKEALKALSKRFKWVAVDSGSKLKEMTNAWIEELREECPDTSWILMFQQNEKGNTRGGSSAEFDAPVVLKTYRPDWSDPKKNYALLYKNRGNATGKYYLINKRVITSKEPLKKVA